MSELFEVYDDETLESWDEDALRECQNYAKLIERGIIPTAACVQLGAEIGHEKAYLVRKALEGLDQ